MAAAHSTLMCLTNRYREQARLLQGFVVFSVAVTAANMGMLNLRRHNPSTHLQPLKNPALIDDWPSATVLFYGRGTVVGLGAS
jgi:hypothetical protein